jgi:hypothetical protein
MKPKTILCFVLLLFAGLVGCLLFARAQFFQDCNLAKFSSPANSANEVWFLDGGFLDRDLILYAKPKGQTLRRLANLWWSPDCYFSQAQWTKDGEVIVCALKVRDAGDRSFITVAFDFSDDKPITPAWMTVNSFDNRPESEWCKQELIIKEVITAHGGLSDEKIDDNTIRSREKHPWFWQLPKI